MSDVAYKLLEKQRTKEKARSIAKVLRVALSIGSVVVCSVLFILWARSYTFRDRVVVPFSTTRCLSIDSNHGKLEFETYGPGMGEWTLSVTSLSYGYISAVWREQLSGLGPEPQNRKKWRWERTMTGRFFVYVPHWLPIILITALAAVPWIRWRFTTRTLLIATTLIAVVLGLIVYLAR